MLDWEKTPKEENPKLERFVLLLKRESYSTEILIAQVLISVYNAEF